jgi:uncharacterized protein
MRGDKGTLGIIGASGFIGTELARQAANAGWEVCGFSRQPHTGSREIPFWREWSGRPDLAGLNAVVNLSGHPIHLRWTRENKQLFHQSRIGVTETLAKAIARLPDGKRPEVVVNGSGIGIYGDRGDEVLTENSTRGEGYLADLSSEWEAAALPIHEAGARVVTLRTGVVLGRGGEAFEKMARLFRRGLGGRLGSGEQWMPWIHLHDIAAAILFSIDNHRISGPVNGCAPTPERNADFTRKLAKACRRPAIFHAPAIALKLALGEFSSALLSSERAVPELLEARCYHFRHPTLESALADLLGKPVK